MHPILLAGILHSANKIGREKVLLTVSPFSYRQLCYDDEVTMCINGYATVVAKYTFSYKFSPISPNAFEQSRISFVNEVKSTPVNISPLPAQPTQTLIQASLDAVKFELSSVKRNDISYDIDSTGKVLSEHLDRSRPTIAPIIFGSLFDIEFPTEPVGVGDSWTRNFGPAWNIYQRDTEPREVTFRLVSRTCSVAQITASLTQSVRYKQLEPYIYWVDISSGRCISASGRVKIQYDDQYVIVGFEEKMVTGT